MGLQEIKKFKKRYDYGRIGNGVLYEMCKKYPYHKDIAEVVGKTWIIGRSYAVSLERNKNNKNISDDFYSKKVAPCFIKGNFDKKLSDVRKLRELKEKNIPIILKTHKEVVDFIRKKVTKDNKRSFASKYLHFHFPKLFFIYDSRASNAIDGVVRSVGGFKYSRHIKNIRRFDKSYATFFVKCFYFQDFCKKNGVSLTTRQIDSFLVDKANEKIRKKKIKK